MTAVILSGRRVVAPTAVGEEAAAVGRIRLERPVGTIEEPGQRPATVEMQPGDVL